MTMDKFFGQIRNRTGDVLSAASVTVVDYTTGAIAALFADNGITSRANPIISDVNGRFEFCAAGGKYRAVAVRGGEIGILDHISVSG